MDKREIHDIAQSAANKVLESQGSCISAGMTLVRDHISFRKATPIIFRVNLKGLVSEDDLKVPHSELAMHLGAAGRDLIAFALTGTSTGVATYDRGECACGFIFGREDEIFKPPLVEQLNQMWEKRGPGESRESSRGKVTLRPDYQAVAQIMSPQEEGKWIAEQIGEIRYDGEQERIGHQFTDLVTGTTFHGNTIEEVKATLIQSRKDFGAAPPTFGGNPGQHEHELTPIAARDGRHPYHPPDGIPAKVYPVRASTGEGYTLYDMSEGVWFGRRSDTYQEAIGRADKENRRLWEAHKALSGNPGEYITIVDPGKTVFNKGETISLETFERENERVMALNEAPATGLWTTRMRTNGEVP